MFSLPRGVGATTDVALASAAWETPQGTERLAYRADASIFIGAIPASENWPLLKEIYDRGGAELAAMGSRTMPSAQRAEKIEELEQLWRDALLADCIPLGVNDDRHFVTIAGSRSGKGTSAIIPNLCLYPGSIVCLDPKGENAERTAERRGAGSDHCEGLGQEVFVLDPFGVARVPEALRAGLNPLALLDPDSPDVADDAAMLSETLVVSHDEKDSHWDESARNLIKGVILHLITVTDRPSLLTLRRFLTQGDREGWDAVYSACTEDADRDEFLRDNPSPVTYLLNSMRLSQHPTLAGLIAGAAETVLSCGENERGSIFSTARRNTAFLDTLRQDFVDTLEGTGRTFSPDIFKKAVHGASLFLCLPAERMGTHGRWLRLMIGVLLEWAYRDRSPPACGAPILFLLEEFHSLGYMAMIEKAAGYAAGFGIKLWAVIQDLQQLKALYPKSWQTFLANAGAVQVFGVSDHDTTTYVSQALGEVEVIRNVTNRSENYQTGQSAPSVQQKVSGLLSGRAGLFPVRVAIASLPESGTNEGHSVSNAVSEQIQIVPLLRPDEVAMQFTRESGAALLLIKGRRPVWYLRVDYHASPWFWGRYTSDEIARDRDIRPFGERAPEALRAIAARFAQAPR